jgi:hypothetical protein
MARHKVRRQEAGRWQPCRPGLSQLYTQCTTKKDLDVAAELDSLMRAFSLHWKIVLLYSNSLLCILHGMHIVRTVYSERLLLLSA